MPGYATFTDGNGIKRIDRPRVVDPLAEASGHEWKTDRVADYMLLYDAYLNKIVSSVRNSTPVDGYSFPWSLDEAKLQAQHAAYSAMKDPYAPDGSDYLDMTEGPYAKAVGMAMYMSDDPLDTSGISWFGDGDSEDSKQSAAEGLAKARKMAESVPLAYRAAVDDRAKKALELQMKEYDKLTGQSDGPGSYDFGVVSGAINLLEKGVLNPLLNKALTFGNGGNYPSGYYLSPMETDVFGPEGPDAKTPLVAPSRPFFHSLIMPGQELVYNRQSVYSQIDGSHKGDYSPATVDEPRRTFAGRGKYIYATGFYSRKPGETDDQVKQRSADLWYDYRCGMKYKWYGDRLNGTMDDIRNLMSGVDTRYYDDEDSPSRLLYRKTFSDMAKVFRGVHKEFMKSVRPLIDRPETEAAKDLDGLTSRMVGRAFKRRMESVEKDPMRPGEVPSDSLLRWTEDADGNRIMVDAPASLAQAFSDAVFLTLELLQNNDFGDPAKNMVRDLYCHRLTSALSSDCTDTALRALGTGDPSDRTVIMMDYLFRKGGRPSGCYGEAADSPAAYIGYQRCMTAVENLDVVDRQVFTGTGDLLRFPVNVFNEVIKTGTQAADFIEKNPLNPLKIPIPGIPFTGPGNGLPEQALESVNAFSRDLDYNGNIPEFVDSVRFTQGITDLMAGNAIYKKAMLPLISIQAADSSMEDEYMRRLLNGEPDDKYTSAKSWLYGAGHGAVTYATWRFAVPKANDYVFRAARRFMPNAGLWAKMDGVNPEGLTFNDRALKTMIHVPVMSVVAPATENLSGALLDEIVGRDIPGHVGPKGRYYSMAGDVLEKYREGLWGNVKFGVAMEAADWVKYIVEKTATRR